MSSDALCEYSKNLFRSRGFLFPDFSTGPLLLLTDLSRMVGAKLLRFLYLAEFYLAMAEGRSCTNRFILRFNFDDPKSGNQVLTQMKRRVCHKPLAAIEPDASAFRSRV
jgi:hypothetical protein